MMGALLAVSMVFFGCCSNVVFLELLISAHPGSGNIITFAQFIFVAIEGFINEMRWGRKKNAIPLSHYSLLVLMFLSSNVLNNYALNFHIPLPLHMIFRSGSLIANLLLGILILKRTYPPSKYLAVITITIGICISTLASSPPKAVTPSVSNATNPEFTDPAPDEEATVPLLERLIGISMLTFALFVSALMGIYQEKMYKQFGKHPHEALFFAHALPLPAFAMMWSSISTHASLYSASPLLTVPGFGTKLPLPSMWFFLLGNVVTQLVCIKGVYVLSSEVSSLVCTLVITLRKFISLLFSIFYFKNPFSTSHWVGTMLVFGGTVIFLDLINMIKTQFSTSRSTTQKNDYTEIKKKE